MPKVSVVIPTHNRAAFLRPAIQSVLNQTFQDFEIIVVDDASQDETPWVIRSFTDARIQYIRHDVNKGQGATRNDGISVASGEYVAFLDDDDEWLPLKLEKQVSLLDSSPPNVGLIYTGFYRVAGTTKQVIDRIMPEQRGYAFAAICAKNWIRTLSTVVIRKGCFDKIGSFDEGLASGVDYDMWLRISAEFEINYIAELLVSYTVHDNRISMRPEAKILGLEALLGKHRAHFARNRQSYSEMYLSLGVNYCLAGDTRKGREAFGRAIRLYPFEVRNYYNLCLSLLGKDNFKNLKQFRDKYLDGGRSWHSS